MENLRAFMVITALREIDLHFEHYPNDVETNSDTSETIVEKGFFIAVGNEEDLERALQAIKLQNSIHSYEVIENASAKPAEKAPASQSRPMSAAESAGSAQAASAPAQNSTQTSSAPAQSSAPAASTATHNSAPVKQSLISVNLSKLDSLVAIVGEIVITESMVTSSPDLQNLKLDNFTKSARQLRKLTDDLQDIAM